MTLLFRKLNRKRHWDAERWLGPEDTQADAAKCLATSGNRLSVFMIEEPVEQMKRVVAALAVTRDSLAHFDLAIVPENVLARCEIGRDRSPGQTLDAGVNEWHHDLVELTVHKLARLAAAIKCRGEVRRCSLKEVGYAIQKSLNSNYIGMENVNAKCILSLRKRGLI